MADRPPDGRPTNRPTIRHETIRSSSRISKHEEGAKASKHRRQTELDDIIVLGTIGAHREHIDTDIDIDIDRYTYRHRCMDNLRLDETPRSVYRRKNLFCSFGCDPVAPISMLNTIVEEDYEKTNLHASLPA